MMEVATEISSVQKKRRRSNFLDQIYRDWTRSTHPERVMSYVSGDEIQILPQYDLNYRFHVINSSIQWTFNIKTQGKQLELVSLAPCQHHRNFAIKAVYQNGREYIPKNSREWHNQKLQPYTEKSAKYQYFVTIMFAAETYATYRQSIIFYFGEFPAIIRKICADGVPEQDLVRMHTTTLNQLSRIMNIWIENTTLIRWLESPFITVKDPKERELSLLYPFPDKYNYFLTQQMLIDDCYTRQNYKGRLHELIATEEVTRQELLGKYNEMTYMRLMSQYALAMNGSTATAVKYAPPGELFAQLLLSRNISEDTKSGRLLIESCTTLLIKPLLKDAKAPIVFEVHIEDKCTQTIFVRLPKDCVNALNLVPDTELQAEIQFVLNRRIFGEWHRAVDGLPDVGYVFLDKKEMCLREQDIQAILQRNELGRHVNWDWRIFSFLLNVVQSRAVKLITIPTSISLPPILLVGPAGTGKTFTIAHAIRTLLSQTAGSRIVLCTKTNTAADRYIREFFDVWYKAENSPRFKPMRIYHSVCDKITIHPVVQEHTLMDGNFAFRDPTEDDIRETSLIITTLLASSSLLGLNYGPTHIFIDEAGEALECEALIPLTLATPRTRFIFAGDHMLPTPEIFSDLAEQCGFGVSFLQRMYKMYPPSHPCKIHLCLNYTCHSDIVKFVSDTFYYGLVQPCSKAIVKHPTLKPLTFYAVHGEVVQSYPSGCYVNVAEAVELANRILELKNSWPESTWGPYTDESIGVVSSYRAQVQKIQCELCKRNLHNVPVDSTLDIKGKQFAVLFVSTVRTKNSSIPYSTSEPKNSDFLTDPRLLNLALGRTQSLLVVAGDPFALVSLGSCRKLWQKFLDASDLHGISRDTLRHYFNSMNNKSHNTTLNPLAKEFVLAQPSVLRRRIR